MPEQFEFPSDIGTPTISLGLKVWAEEEKKKALEYLAPLNFYPTQADTLAKRTQSTGEWLFKDAKFREWLAGTGKSNSLICTGIRKYLQDLLFFRKIRKLRTRMRSSPGDTVSTCSAVSAVSDNICLNIAGAGKSVMA